MQALVYLAGITSVISPVIASTLPLIAREDQVTTNVTFQPGRLRYGSFQPTDMFKQLETPCTQGTGFCDDSLSGKIQNKTKIWNSDSEHTQEAILTLNWDGSFEPGMGGPMVEAIIMAAETAKECQQRSTIDNVEDSRGAGGSTIETYCQSTSEVQIVKYKLGGATSSLRAWVEMEIEDSPFDWCDLAALGDAIVAGFDGPAIAAGGFGFISFVCDAAAQGDS